MTPFDGEFPLTTVFNPDNTRNISATKGSYYQFFEAKAAQEERDKRVENQKLRAITGIPDLEFNRGSGPEPSTTPITDETFDRQMRAVAKWRENIK